MVPSSVIGDPKQDSREFHRKSEDKKIDVKKFACLGAYAQFVRINANNYNRILFGFKYVDLFKTVSTILDLAALRFDCR
jgi:hypothetical protein